MRHVYAMQMHLLCVVGQPRLLGPELQSPPEQRTPRLPINGHVWKPGEGKQWLPWCHTCPWAMGSTPQAQGPETEVSAGAQLYRYLCMAGQAAFHSPRTYYDENSYVILTRSMIATSLFIPPVLYISLHFDCEWDLCDVCFAILNLAHDKNPAVKRKAGSMMTTWQPRQRDTPAPYTPSFKLPRMLMKVCKERRKWMTEGGD